MKRDCSIKFASYEHTWMPAERPSFQLPYSLLYFPQLKIATVSHSFEFIIKLARKKSFSATREGANRRKMWTASAARFFAPTHILLVIYCSRSAFCSAFLQTSGKLQISTASSFVPSRLKLRKVLLTGMPELGKWLKGCSQSSKTDKWAFCPLSLLHLKTRQVKIGLYTPEDWRSPWNPLPSPHKNIVQI